MVRAKRYGLLNKLFLQANSRSILTCYEILVLEGVFFEVEEQGFAVEAFDEFVAAVPDEAPFFEGGMEDITVFLRLAGEDGTEGKGLHGGEFFAAGVVEESGGDIDEAGEGFGLFVLLGVEAGDD